MKKLTIWQTSGPCAYQCHRGFWEEISERSIKAKRVSELIAPKKGKKNKPRKDSGASSASASIEETLEEELEIDEVVIIEPTWM